MDAEDRKCSMYACRYVCVHILSLLLSFLPLFPRLFILSFLLSFLFSFWNVASQNRHNTPRNTTTSLLSKMHINSDVPFCRSENPTPFWSQMANETGGKGTWIVLRAVFRGQPVHCAVAGFTPALEKPCSIKSSDWACAGNSLFLIPEGKNVPGHTASPMAPCTPRHTLCRPPSNMPQRRLQLMRLRQGQPLNEDWQNQSSVCRSHEPQGWYWDTDSAPAFSVVEWAWTESQIPCAHLQSSHSLGFVLKDDVTVSDYDLRRLVRQKRPEQDCLAFVSWTHDTWPVDCGFGCLLKSQAKKNPSSGLAFARQWHKAADQTAVEPPHGRSSCVLQDWKRNSRCLSDVWVKPEIR